MKTVPATVQVLSSHSSTLADDGSPLDVMPRPIGPRLGTASTCTGECGSSPCSCSFENCQLPLSDFIDGDIPEEWVPLLRVPCAITDLVTRWNEFTPISSLEGRWELLLQRSDSIDDIMRALGVPRYKRHFLATCVSTTTIRLCWIPPTSTALPALILTGSEPSSSAPPSRARAKSPPAVRAASPNHHNAVAKKMKASRPPTHNAISITTQLMAGIKKQGTPFSDGRVLKTEDRDLEVCWTTRAQYTDGRLLQKSTSSKGTLYDVRCVFQQGDPEKKSPIQPILLFKWTFINTEGQKYSVLRWMQKLD